MQGSDNTVELAALDGTVRARFLHPAAIKTLEANRTGTKVLTVTTDNVVRLWPTNGSDLPAILSLPERRCFPRDDADRPAARFDLSGTRILASRCDGI